MVKWFGKTWGAPICDPHTHIETPDGEACPGCMKTIRDGDQGVEIPFSGGPEDPPVLDWHLNCFLAEIGIPKIQ